MRIIIIGASGLIGSNLYLLCKSKGRKVIGTYYKSKIKKDLIYFDIVNDNITNIIKNISKDDIFVIFSANTDPSWISKNKEKAKLINVTATKKLIKSLKNYKCKIIFMSSVEVFDGKKDIYYENDKVNPLNYYGKMKVDVENYLKSEIKNHLILRTSWNSSFTLNYRCVIQLTYNSILKDNAIMATDNELSITYVKDLSKYIYKFLNTNEKIIHIANNNKILRYQIAELIKLYSKFRNKMKFKKVAYKKIKYKEPRGLKNLLGTKIINKYYKINFMKIENIIKKKVKIIDEKSIQD